jgi:hypothetical protein
MLNLVELKAAAEADGASPIRVISTTLAQIAFGGDQETVDEVVESIVEVVRPDLESFTENFVMAASEVLSDFDEDDMSGMSSDPDRAYDLIIGDVDDFVDSDVDVLASIFDALSG